MIKNFTDSDLIAPIQKSLVDEGYTKPTPIQQLTIPAAISGQDILGSAQTGTGKTAAFALPILNRLGSRNRKARPKRPFALVLVPTRELAIQIDESFKNYGRYLKLRRALVYGGVNQNRQVRALERGAHILIATPGRLLDLMEQGYIQLNDLEVFVLDEADRMLDMGFLPDLRRIIACLPEKRQSLFFSATLPPTIVELTKQLLHQPVNVQIEPETKSVKAIQQIVAFVGQNKKLPLLRKVLRGKDVDRSIVFTRTKRGANRVAEKLEQVGIRSAVIHGNKSQNARQSALREFRGNRVSVLVATDVAARGIDVDGITHVINFDVPTDPESYIHRIGRTGRAGAAGVAYSFCSNHEKREFIQIERLIQQRIPRIDEVDGPFTEDWKDMPAEAEHEPTPRKREPRDGARHSKNANQSKSRSKSNAASSKQQSSSRKRFRRSGSEDTNEKSKRRPGSGGKKSSRKPSVATAGQSKSKSQKPGVAKAKKRPTRKPNVKSKPHVRSSSQGEEAVVSPAANKKKRKKSRPGRRERQLAKLGSTGQTA